MTEPIHAAPALGRTQAANLRYRKGMGFQTKVSGVFYGFLGSQTAAGYKPALPGRAQSLGGLRA